MQEFSIATGADYLIWLRNPVFTRAGACTWRGYNGAMAESVSSLIDSLAARLAAAGARVCAAESCTGGLIAKSFTDLAGSSDWFERGFVSYSNQAKHDMLGVPVAVIAEYGAVSEAVASAMASGALRHSAADYALAVTGIAGPGGGSEDKPVGTVWIAVASAGQQRVRHYCFDGDRAAVRDATCAAAIEMLLELLDSE